MKARAFAFGMYMCYNIIPSEKRKNGVNDLNGKDNNISYTVSIGIWDSVFAVPSDVVDRHMKLAGAAQLKTLLYLLRHGGEPVTLDALAFAIGQKPSDTRDALDYWVNCGLLSEADSKSAFRSGDKSEPVPAPEQEKRDIPEASVSNALGTAPEKKAPVTKEKIRYPFDECMKYVAEDEQLKNMLTAVEATLGKQLTHTEVTCFVTLVKWHGLPCTVVPMLAQYCKSIGKPSMSYIEATGIGWCAEEIDNFEKAEKKISALTAKRKAWNTVRSALEIPERKATDSELKYCDLWINSQRFEVELVRHAYDKCINKNGKISFAYMNGILKRYFEQGITDLTSALKSDEQNREAMEARRQARGISSQPRGGKSSNNNERYGETYATEDIEAILDAEWAKEIASSSGDYDYDE